MKVAVTGALGTLGSAVVDDLAARPDVAVVPVDRRSSPDRAVVEADVRDAERMTEVLDGCDVVVHLAGLHGTTGMQRHTEDEFWSVNVDGTRAVYQAAERADVRHVVLASSMAVYGAIPKGPRRRWVVRDETCPVAPVDVYSLTKVVGEQLALHHALATGLSTTVLRFGHFEPRDPLHTGFRLMFGGVDLRDAVAAVSLAADRAGRARGVEHVNVHADPPFERSDLDELSRDAVAAVSVRWPDLVNLLGKDGENVAELVWGRGLWPNDEARAVLGFRPRWSFERFARSYVADGRASVDR